MPNLFGLDIAKIIADNIAAAGGVLDATLIKEVPGTRTAGSLTGGTNPVETSYTAKGFKSALLDLHPGSLVAEASGVIVLIGATIQSGVVPDVGDRVTIEGSTHTILKVDRDPAAATYTCQVK